MIDKKRSMARHVSGLIRHSQKPRNQIASISGLTNTYIRDLEQGNIANVPREKLIALAVALNLDLNQTDEMLTVFDRALLSTDDIPTFLKMADRCRLSAALLPVKDMFAYELVMLASESITGDQVIINDRPTSCLETPGHRSHTDQPLLASHPVFGDLLEAIGAARSRNFLGLLAKSRVELYICRHCLTDYVLLCDDELQKHWRLKHVAATLDALRSFPDFRVYLTNICVNFNFTLKMPDNAEKSNPKVLFSARAPHYISRNNQGRLTGFATENPAVVQNFQDEAETVRQKVVPGLVRREQVMTWLDSFLEKAGFNAE